MHPPAEHPYALFKHPMFLLHDITAEQYPQYIPSATIRSHWHPVAEVVGRVTSGGVTVRGTLERIDSRTAQVPSPSSLFPDGSVVERRAVMDTGSRGKRGVGPYEVVIVLAEARGGAKGRICDAASDSRLVASRFLVTLEWDVLDVGDDTISCISRLSASKSRSLKPLRARRLTGENKFVSLKAKFDAGKPDCAPRFSGAGERSSASRARDLVIVVPGDFDEILVGFGSFEGFLVL